ncbi:MAG: hypothetical protein MUF62_03340 [Chitinophagaceae bacterium]|nr:hypothetical protein [Chitinophagaceae bacterium]
MRLSSLLTLLLMLSFIVSCQKEFSFESDNAPGTDVDTTGSGSGSGNASDTALLYRTEMKEADGEPINRGFSTYDYNSARQVVKVQGQLTTDVGIEYFYNELLRDAGGTIIGAISYDSENGSDTLFGKAIRNVAGRIISFVRYSDRAYSTIYDSTVYTWSGQWPGQAIQYDMTDPSDPIPLTRLVLTFNTNGLLSKMDGQEWDDIDGKWDPQVLSSVFTYDNNPSPLAGTLDEFLVGFRDLIGNRNLLKIEGGTAGILAPLSENTYQYRTDGRPASANIKSLISASGAKSVNQLFFYR